MNETCTHTDTNAIPIQKGTEELDVIPFVDEAPAAIAEPVLTAQPARDSADEAFGPVSRRPSVVDRELGLDRMNMKRQGKYACPCCGHGASRVVRVRVAHRPGWSAVCAVCAATLLAKIPGTIVGGMVRPTKRRRTRKPNQVAHGFRPVAQNGYRRAG